MRRLIYQVAVGPSCKLYEFCIASVADYCKRIGAEHIVQREPLLRIKPDPKTSGRSDGASRLGYLPIFEKENAFGYLGEYEQVAVIDADVWVRPGSPDLFAQEWGVHCDFAAVIEREMYLTPHYYTKIRSYGREQYQDLQDVDWQWNEHGPEFYNMGVMLMDKSLLRFLDGDTPREFLARPEFKRFVDGVGKWKWSTDQTLLNWWLRKCGVKHMPLDWEWNGLYGALRDDYIKHCHFVHFFLRDYLPNKGENIEELVAKL